MSLVRLVIKLNENRFLLRGGRRIMIHSRAVGRSENPERGQASSYVVGLLCPLPLIRIGLTYLQNTGGQFRRPCTL